MTLAFSWATSANYSAGPDVGTPTKVDPASVANGFIKGVIAAPQHVNYLFAQIADQLVNAVDGVGGGTYTLDAPLVFDGDEVQIASLLRILDDGILEVDVGAFLNVYGLLDISGQAQVSGVFNVVPGGMIDVIGGGSIELNVSEDLKIDDVLNYFRLTLTPQSIQLDSGGTPTSWKSRVGVAFTGRTGSWYQDEVAFAPSIAFPLNLPAGDEIVSVVAQVDGSQAGSGHAAKPIGDDLPVLALVRVDGQGVAEVVARRKDQAIDVTGYNALHTITLTGGALDDGTLSHTVDSNYVYYVVLHGEKGANAEASKYGLLAISGTCVARSYRSALMTY
jgi:hypothetical protein